ncbi:hypothetical protein ACWE42_13065 [Sutcliffiella cohnii]|uniref:Uncharacterized protein n=1 Tax=Sutcliffiella cohnii TaxID=33932 RepID=A0A223KQC2_9BACI|nr:MULTISPECIES: hypothetical protein [Sutcliffiella]AST91682.1 hypothetical protein BC6307_10510 [Sutcliffiella cohnii]MED4014728.1 hypothetical protein [Sutcliffiella cohnii]WBL12903.1 hypothetical protein O1A01_13195 [Sutcliffiella sp. NC1]
MLRIPVNNEEIIIRLKPNLSLYSFSKQQILQVIEQEVVNLLSDREHSFAIFFKGHIIVGIIENHYIPTITVTTIIPESNIHYL